jgi:hypothetical protein
MLDLRSRFFQFILKNLKFVHAKINWIPKAAWLSICPFFMESHKIYCNCIAEQSSSPPTHCAFANGTQFHVSGTISLCSGHEQPSMVL